MINILMVKDLITNLFTGICAKKVNLVLLLKAANLMTKALNSISK
jgi:hypothetical protein